MRASGILMHLSCLPGDFGLGTIGQEAYNFIYFLNKSKLKYWQILPLNIPDKYNSPYKSSSAFALNHYFIDTNFFVEMGYISDLNCKKQCKDLYESIDMAKIAKISFLKEMFLKSKDDFKVEIEQFKEKNIYWLKDYALYMVLKKYEPLCVGSIENWPKELLYMNKSKMSLLFEKYKNEIEFYVFLQYLMYIQWMNLKQYANEHDVKIIGDMPMYISYQSAEVWGKNDVFLLNNNKNMIEVASVPPDDLCEDGQLWNMPVYNWNVIKEKNWEFWIERFKQANNIYDVARLDHFRGFESFYAVKAGESTAKSGKWYKGPGRELFKAAERNIEGLKFIAEDLGDITIEVKQMLNDLGYPGTKVVQFGFGNNGEEHMPHNYPRNCVAYTSTHDNDTIIGWMNNLPVDMKKRVKKYFNLQYKKNYNWKIIESIYASKADIVIISVQDFLGLDSKARMNIPGTIDGNWLFKLNVNKLDDKLSKEIENLNKLFNRY